MSAGGFILAAAAGAHRAAAESADEAWGKYASAKGLTFRPSRLDDAVGGDEPRLHGTVDGVSIAFELSMIGGEWGVHAIAVPIAPVAVRLELSREGLMSKIAKVFGARDILLGDAAFDKAFLVHGSHDERARLVLTPDVRAAMLALEVRTLVYDDGSTKERGAVAMLGLGAIPVEPSGIERLIALLVAIGRARA